MEEVIQWLQLILTVREKFERLKCSAVTEATENGG